MSKVLTILALFDAEDGWYVDEVKHETGYSFVEVRSLLHALTDLGYLTLEQEKDGLVGRPTYRYYRTDKEI